MLKKFFLINFLLIILLFPTVSWGRDNSEIYDWYIKDFNSEIVVNKDSSLLITEKIIADCGNLPNKHGIFRVLPTAINAPEGKIITPIELISITDFSGNSLKYQTIRSGGTITWKIGDPDRTVKGENEYKIVYKVKNAIRFQENFDELYWNLNGNFWEIEIDSYSADIKFPAEINKDNAEIEYYAGAYGKNDSNSASWQWSGNALYFQSERILRRGEGITASVAMPKNIFTPYKVSLSDKFPGWQYLFLPIITFLACFLIWKKYGADPNLRRTVIAEYEAPDNLMPLPMGMLCGLGGLKQEYIAATIIKMASDGIIKIEETNNKILFFNSKDHKLTVIDEKKAASLADGEKEVFDGFFDGKKEVMLSEVKKTFYQSFPMVEKKTKNWLRTNGYIEKSGNYLKFFMYNIPSFLIAFFIIFIFFGNTSSALESFGIALIASLILSLAIILIFSVFMPKRTIKGAEAEWKIKGFKLFIETAEKYRAQFYEKENMFEKILPYAIAFGLTKKWIKAMRDIYGDDKFLAMAPVWYISASGKFDIDSFSASLNSVSSSIASSASTTSGQSGGGFSGGGGGGGGGGGW